MGDTNVQECNCCQTEADCINGLCELCSGYNYKLQKQSDLLTLGLLQAKQELTALKNSHVTESIYACEDFTIPLADIQHLDKRGDWFFIITKHTKYNTTIDDWENPVYVSAKQSQGFLDAWFKYRCEFDRIVCGAEDIKDD
jgi:hypothetical protein